MKHVSLILALLLALSGSTAFAVTYNEPWHDAVLAESDALIRARVKKVGSKRSATVEVLATLAGGIQAAELKIAGFWGLAPEETAPSEEFPILLIKGQEYYLFVSKSPNGNYWTLPTPTAGITPIVDGVTHATYRHSYHQAIVSIELYELSMTALFRGAHGTRETPPALLSFIEEALAAPPAALESPPDGVESASFFGQHVALESIFHLGLAQPIRALEPFINSQEAHAQISAVRALSRIAGPEATQRLVQVLHSEADPFAKVITTWTLRDRRPTTIVPTLKQLLLETTDQEAGFGGNIMDPRVGTHFPDSVHEALRELLTALEAPEP